MLVEEIIEKALLEDIGDGDHSSLACVPENAKGNATLFVKDEGILAGVDLAVRIFKKYDPILATERLVLNFMQRMSGIATQTNQIVSLLEGTNTRLLDTRKTTPCIRYMEKWAVRIGGGENHRFALYDMIMLKDNHIDYAGGIQPAIERTQAYLKASGKNLKVEVEVRDLNELNQVLAVGGVDRIMLDNFSPTELSEALKLIPSNYETEASGGITLETIREYAETGVDFISVGALTHSFKSLDMSLKAEFSK